MGLLIIGRTRKMGRKRNCQLLGGQFNRKGNKKEAQKMGRKRKCN